LRSAKRFSRHLVSSSRGAFSVRLPHIGSLVLAVFLIGCGPRGTVRTDGATGCRDVNELLALAARGELAMSGRVTIDVNQYRVRGRFHLYISAKGDVTLEYTSSGVMGGGREDAAFAFASDTLRVFDREHGDFYEGDDVVELVAGATERRIDVAALLRRITARPVDCDGTEFRPERATGGKGTWNGGEFRLRRDPATNRLLEASWHLASLDADAEITYRWDGPDRLTGLTVEVPAYRWRIRLEADS